MGLNYFKKSKNFLQEKTYQMIVRMAYKQGKAALKHKTDTLKMGFITEEFFHMDLRGFGGYGKTVKNISDYYVKNNADYQFKVVMAEGLPKTSVYTAIKQYHDTDVLLRPPKSKYSFGDTREYVKTIRAMDLKLFITIDCYRSYQYPLFLAPHIPLLIWIHDPRDKEEWAKIATVDMVKKQREMDDLTPLAEEKARAIKDILQLGEKFSRKIIFASNGEFLTQRAKSTYAMPELDPYPLYNPMVLPEDRIEALSQKPSLLFMGRIDPVKRPWVVFELAKKFPQVDFYIAGATHRPDMMQSLIDGARHQDNILFLGLVGGDKKHQVLKQCWGLINTSIHEGLPVSFQEAFAYAKPIISCHDPDGLVSRFGYFTGEVLGEGTDEESINKFSEQIKLFVSDSKQRREKGEAAQAHVAEVYSFENFNKCFKNILIKEGLI
ncbi:MAG: glycosyltransferase family 4 protein [Candidatus Omnitrophica bacterium]|nr:glycosyltransferase family 4 protein [Candidatus Omnitrophota bacterium]